MKYRNFFIFMIILILISGLTSLISPILLNYWMSDAVGFTTSRIIILLGALLLSLVLQLVFIYFREKFAKNFNIKNCKSMLEKYFQLSYDKINDEGPTNLVERIAQAVNNIYAFMTGDYIKIWSSILVMSVILIIISFQSLLITTVMLLIIPINYFGYKALNKELSKRSKKLQEQCASGWQQVFSFVGQTDYLKQCATYDEIISQLSPSLNNIYGSMKDVNVFAQSASSLISSINGIVRTMVLALVVYQFASSNTSPITLVLFTIVLPMYFNNVSIITNANLSKRDMKISLDLLKEWDNCLEPDGENTIKSIDTIDFDIKELAIKGKKLSKDIKEHFEKGNVVWIKGKSGSGKSTLLKLLPKFREASTIYINGENINSITNASLRSKLDYLSQNVPIIKGTLRDNLFFNKEYSKEIENQLINEPIIASILKDKSLDDKILEGGSNLSGGEKQKIAIARALYDNVDVLILDEVTSNIDKKSSDEIFKQIMLAKNDKIIFIISHDDLPKSYATKFIEI
ncbi:ABC transporter ATP-binding protein [Sedimentibacter sp. zth1]|uniref:ATP-binding cassette domain-containing protein n=1 Tax=Sedimentibacter sp. zth1 TaxID=2816908 RepID=UPI001A93956B|nr:ABC transporter ATP-binding protein [Sedimentibacter sp. zth1]QSX04749.1 ABC transporter ATP-binding protein [Sedimentibacter sp. zth1]